MSRGRIIFWSLLLAAAVLGVWTFFSLREPRAHGEPLSHWLRLGVESGGWFNPFAPSPEAEAAIREIGIRAIPTLLAKLQATDAPWKERTYEWLNKQDLYKFEPTTEEQERTQGIYGFMALGTNALPALPELERLFWNTNTSWAAAGAMGQLGLPAVPILRTGLNSTNSVFRSTALYGSSSANLAKATLPDVRPLIHDPDIYTSLAAFSRLVSFAPKEEATALIVGTLQTNRTRLRGVALSRVGHVNVETNAIFPVLLNMLNDSDPRFRNGVTNALRRLDPVAAAAAGINTNPLPVSTGRAGGRRRGSAPAATNATNSSTSRGAIPP